MIGWHPEGLTSLIVHPLFNMTATQLKPRPVRKQVTTKKTMTEQSYSVTKTFTHSEPIVINSHLDNVPVISGASYIKDARNRWYIHSTEVKELWDQHVNIFNAVKPYVVSAVDRVKELTSKKG